MCGEKMKVFTALVPHAHCDLLCLLSRLSLACLHLHPLSAFTVSVRGELTSCTVIVPRAAFAPFQQQP